MEFRDRFSREALVGKIKGRTIRGAQVAFGGKVLQTMVALLSTAVLARILTPADFGLVAVMTSITNFLIIFKDFGLSMATIQRDDIAESQVASLFWINVAVGILLAALMYSSSSILTVFFGDSRLREIAQLLSIIFVFGGLSAQHIALMKRQIRADMITLVDTVALVIAALVAIGCAIKGFGYWALVMQQLTIPFVTMLLSWFFSGWHPFVRCSTRDLKELLLLGGNLSIFTFLNYFARNADNVLLGRYHGAEVLGVYSRAYSIVMMPIALITNPLTSVAVPSLSRLQSDSTGFALYFLGAVKLIGYLSFTLAMILFCTAEQIVALILGSNWGEAVFLLQVLSVVAFVQPVASTVGWVYIALGRTRRMAAWGAVACPLIVLFFAAGLPWGAKGVAVSYSLCVLLILYPQIAFALSGTPVNASRFFAELLNPLVVSLISGCILTLLSPVFVGQPALLVIIYSLLVVLCVGLILLLLSSRVRDDLMSLKRLLHKRHV